LSNLSALLGVHSIFKNFLGMLSYKFINLQLKAKWNTKQRTMGDNRKLKNIILLIKQRICAGAHILWLGEAVECLAHAMQILT